MLILIFYEIVFIKGNKSLDKRNATVPSVIPNYDRDPCGQMPYILYVTVIVLSMYLQCKELYNLYPQNLSKLLL